MKAVGFSEKFIGKTISRMVMVDDRLYIEVNTGDAFEVHAAPVGYENSYVYIMCEDEEIIDFD